MLDEKDRIEIIKDILFTEDRAFIEKISERLRLLEKMVNEKKSLSTKVNPIIRDELKDFTARIPETLGPTIVKTLKEEVKNSRDDVVDALYPLLGKMIKKYVAQEINMLSEKMDSQFNFVSRWKLKLKLLFSSKKGKEVLLQEMAPSKIEQVLLIEKDSGILKASYTKANSIDEEMVSGMLTAIKSFVEDAFNQKNQNLELIEYELYQILTQSFVTHYIAVVVSGPFGIKSKDKLQDIIFEFYNRYMAMNVDLVVDLPTPDTNDMERTQSAVERELAKSFGNAKI